MTPVRFEPAALRSRVKHSTTEPLRSLISNYLNLCQLRPPIIRKCFRFICTSLASLTCYSTDFFRCFSILRASWKYPNGSKDFICQIANIGIWIMHTQNAPYMDLNSFAQRLPVFSKLSDFFLFLIFFPDRKNQYLCTWCHVGSVVSSF